MHNADYVVHAAATKIVPTAEYDPFECIKTYINGAMNLIDACIDQKIKEAKVSGPISKKLYIDNNELVAEKILKIWESLDDNSLSKLNNWIKFYWFVKIMNFLRACWRILGKLFPSRFKAFKENHKFSKVDKNDILSRISKLKKILLIEKKIKCKILSDRTIFIKED